MHASLVLGGRNLKWAVDWSAAVRLSSKLLVKSLVDLALELLLLCQFLDLVVQLVQQVLSLLVLQLCFGQRSLFFQHDSRNQQEVSGVLSQCVEVAVLDGSALSWWRNFWLLKLKWAFGFLLFYLIRDFNWSHDE